MRPVIINADDYAMDAGVDAAILKLAAGGIVTAASAMVLSPGWPDAARATLDAPAISWGLHLDLTSPFARDAGQEAGLPELMLRAHARLLDLALLRSLIERQFVLFEKHRGAPPDFIDGHQHVHHLPIVRDTLIEAVNTRYGSGAGGIGIRICSARHWRGLKASIIELTGAPALARLAAKQGMAANTDFAGVYGFEAGADLSRLWEGWLSKLQGSLPLVMCHVAAGDGQSDVEDPIGAARFREFEWLASGAFNELCKRLEIRPVGWPRASDRLRPFEAAPAASRL